MGERTGLASSNASIPAPSPDRRAWLPIPVLLCLILSLWAARLQTPHESLVTLIVMNFLFSTLASVAVTFLLGRSFLARPVPDILLLCSGGLIWGLCSVLAPLLGGDDYNIILTIHNLGVWLGACVLLAGASLARKRERLLPRPAATLVLTFSLVLGLVSLVARLSLAGLIPAFFIPGEGGTLVRQFTLGSAISMLVLTAALLQPEKGRRATSFARLYSLALLLLALGLLGVGMQTVVGSLLGWVGRIAQYLGGLYMLLAALAGLREPDIPVASMDDEPGRARYRYLLAFCLVLGSAALRLILLSALQWKAPFVTFSPAVFLTALYGGLGAGFLATFLAAIFSYLFFTPLPSGLAYPDLPELTAIAAFLLGSALVVALTGAMRVALYRARDAELASRVAAERKRGDDALREVSKRLTFHVEHSPLAVIEWGSDMRLSRWAGEAERIFGWRSDEVLGKRMEDFRWIYEEDKGQVGEVEAGLMSGSSASRFSANRNYRKDGSLLWCEWYNSSLLDESGRLQSILSLVLDVTDRRRAEHELEEAKAQAELYLDLMGHDISNMHQIMLLQLQLARSIVDEKGCLDYGDRSLIDTSVETLGRAARLIDNVRSLQKLRAGAYSNEVVELGRLLEEVLVVYKTIPDRELRVDFKPNGNCFVHANPILKEVFANLLDNCVKHSAGRLEIGIELRKCSEKLGSFCSVSIADNGSGIPDDKKAEVFQRLKRGKTKARGTGLGLYIVKSVVEGFGGKVEIEDRVPGDHAQGAKFMVHLPRCDVGKG